MKKIILLFLFYIVIINLYSLNSLMLTLFPANTTLSSLVNEEICENITILSDKTTNIIIEDKWKINEKSSSLDDYNLTSEEIKVEISYKEKIKLDEKEKIKICIKPLQEGVYSGVIIFKSEQNPAAVGSLIELNVFDNNLSNDKEKNIITGDIIYEEIEKKSKINLFLVLDFIFLISLLFIVIKIKNSNKYRY